jgi:hypothetical protein
VSRSACCGGDGQGTVRIPITASAMNAKGASAKEIDARRSLLANLIERTIESAGITRNAPSSAQPSAIPK